MDSSLSELSGLAASRRHPGVLWTHNDSGAEAKIYAISEAGSTVATVELSDVFALDWEDIAIGPGPDGLDHLYVGDIGDNFELRSFVFVYRLAEPELGDATVESERVGVSYPDGPRDAEALAIDPIDGDLFVITKGGSGQDAAVYRAPVEALVDGARVELERVAELDLPGLVTAADFTVDGNRLVVRTYDEIFVFGRLDGDIASEVTGVPCAAAGPDERGGEAVAAGSNGDLYTVSEGENPTIWRVESR